MTHENGYDVVEEEEETGYGRTDGKASGGSQTDGDAADDGQAALLQTKMEMRRRLY